LTIRPLFSFPEEVAIVATIWSFRNSKWVQEGLPIEMTWQNDHQMTIHRLLLPNFNQLASLETGQILIQFYNPNTESTQSLFFYASNKGGKKQAADQIEKKIKRHFPSNQMATSKFPLDDIDSGEIKEEDFLEQLEKTFVVDSILLTTKEEEFNEPSTKRQKFDSLRYKESKEELDNAEEMPLTLPEDFEELQDLPPNIEVELSSLGLPDSGYFLFLGALGTVPVVAVQFIVSSCMLNFLSSWPKIKCNYLG